MPIDNLDLAPKGWEWGEVQFVPGNPYLDDVMRYVERYHLVIQNGQIETDFTREFDSDFALSLDQIFVGDHTLRHRYSYAIPTERALKWMAGIGPIVEVGAGKGYWALMVSNQSGDVVAYDAIDPRENPKTDREKPWYHVTVADCTVAAEHPDRTLFLCWPPLDSDMATRAALAYLSAGGKFIIYIGEGAGGCTASDSFFEILDAKMTDITPADVDVLSWWGVRDHLYFYRAK